MKTPPLSYSSVSLYLTAPNFRTHSAKPTSNIVIPSFFAECWTLNFAGVGNNWCFQVTESSFVPQVTWPQQGFITRDPKCPHQLLCTVPNAEKKCPQTSVELVLNFFLLLCKNLIISRNSFYLLCYRDTYSFWWRHIRMRTMLTLSWLLQELLYTFCFVQTLNYVQFMTTFNCREIVIVDKQNVITLAKIMAF